MARSPIKLSGKETTSNSSSFVNRNLAVPIDPEEAQAEILRQRENLQSTRNRFTDLYNTIGGVYTNLINAGRRSEAQDLKDATERFARAGSRTGISSDQRVAAIGDLKNKMRVAGQLAEGQIQAQQISQSLNVLNSLSGMDQNSLKVALADARTEIGQSQRQTNRSANSSFISQPTQAPRAQARSPISNPRLDQMRSANNARAAQLAAGNRNAFNIASFLDRRDMAMQRSNPLYQTAGPAYNTSRANYAVTQRDMGQVPGLFKSGPTNRPAANVSRPVSPIAPVNPQQQAFMNQNYGYATPGGGFVRTGVRRARNIKE